MLESRVGIQVVLSSEAHPGVITFEKATSVNISQDDFSLEIYQDGDQIACFAPYSWKSWHFAGVCS